MKNKLIFRILGALASALIITSVFVPFVSVTGYSVSLWEDAVTMDALYLPIMIIAFGAIGVVFFALNIKTEFAYMSAGAITFFGIVQTVDILNQGTFDDLSIGYYFLVVGAILTGLMAFLTNLKVNKNKQEIEPIPQANQPSMLDQIDKLYNEQPMEQIEISPIQPINNVVNPNPIPVQSMTAVVEQSIPVQQPVMEEVQMPQMNLQQEIPVVNSVAQDFVQPTTNPVVQEFSQVQQPTINDFEMPQMNLQQEIPVVNPVVQEFTNSGVGSQQNTNDLDIFSQ